MPKAPGWTEVACPICKEPISAEAQKCPRCLSEFTPEQVAARKKEQQGKFRVGCGVALGLVLFVGWCSAGDDKPFVQEKPAASAKADAIGIYQNVLTTVTPCDNAARAMSDQFAKGDAVAAYRAAQAAERICLGMRTAIKEIPVPASLGKEQHAAMTAALESCQNAYTSKWDMTRKAKTMIDGGASVSVMADLQSAAEDTKGQTMLCTTGMISVAMGLGATLEELGIAPDSK